MDDDALCAALAQLEKDLVNRGYETALMAQVGMRPYLEVRHPQVPRLVERIVANANGFWWPWAERIATLDEVAHTAERVAQVLAVRD
jgi:hypothetical protein